MLETVLAYVGFFAAGFGAGWVANELWGPR